MKQIRAIRRLLAILFFIASAACLILGPQVHPMAKATSQLQIILSAASVTLGATLVWLLLTFLFGRIYCSTVCPIGTFSDLFLALRRRIPRLDRPFSYRPASRWAIHIVWIYALCLLVGIVVVPWLIEPWNIARNMAAVANRGAVASTWATIGVGAGTGAAAGLVSALLIGLTSLWYGREFCRWCPLGNALGALQTRSVMHIEIDPDRCTSCGLCEEKCRTQSIKVVSRLVDPSRCVRCFDCAADCPEDAIRFQINRNRPASPLMRKVKNQQMQ